MRMDGWAGGAELLSAPGMRVRPVGVARRLHALRDITANTTPMKATKPAVILNTPVQPVQLGGKDLCGHGHYRGLMHNM